MIRSLQVLEIKWARELYKVTDGTLAIADSRRECWICGGDFEVGDGMTVVNTGREGSKVTHTRCYQAQQADQ